MKTLLTLTFFAFAHVYLALGDHLVQPISQQEDRNRAVAIRVFEEIFNQGRFEFAKEIYAPEFRNHGRLRDATLEEDQAAVHMEKQAFPDLKMTVNLLVARGDIVSVVWTFNGTHTGPGVGLPPTGASITIRGITIWRMVDGKITEEWTSFNELPPYLEVARHLKLFLMTVGAAIVIGLIVLERILWKLLKISWHHFHH